MSYLVLARKWRPQKFEDVVNQKHVVLTLQNALKTNRLANAYLFAGPRGIGKTTIARILAKAINCETGTKDNPCNECDSCNDITEGRSLDVLEIDLTHSQIDNKTQRYQVTIPSYPHNIQQILLDGGLVRHLQKKRRK